MMDHDGFMDDGNGKTEIHDQEGWEGDSRRDIPHRNLFSKTVFSLEKLDWINMKKVAKITYEWT